jgi:hypothetical protein
MERIMTVNFLARQDLKKLEEAVILVRSEPIV